MTDALRFCVVRETTNTYQVTVYDPSGRLLRESSGVHVSDIIDKLGYELEQLQSQSWASGMPSQNPGAASE